MAVPPYPEYRKIAQAAYMLGRPYIIIITWLIDVIYQIQRYPRTKMTVVHLDSLAPYLVSTRDE